MIASPSPEATERPVNHQCISCGAINAAPSATEFFTCLYCTKKQAVETLGGNWASVQSLKSVTPEARLASERALSQLFDDLADIEVRQILAERAVAQAVREDNHVLGMSVIAGVAISLLLMVNLYWWSLPLILAGGIFLWRSIPPSSNITATIDPAVQERKNLIIQQIARHKAIVQAYDYGDAA